MRRPGPAFDAEDNLSTADAGNHRIRMIKADTGTIATVAGSGPTDEGPPKGPIQEFFI